MLFKSLAIPQDPSHLLNILSQTGGVPAYTQMSKSKHHGTFGEGITETGLICSFLRIKD